MLLGPRLDQRVGRLREGSVDHERVVPGVPPPDVRLNDGPHALHSVHRPGRRCSWAGTPDAVHRGFQGGWNHLMLDRRRERRSRRDRWGRSEEWGLLGAAHGTAERQLTLLFQGLGVQAFLKQLLLGTLPECLLGRREGPCGLRDGVGHQENSVKQNEDVSRFTPEEAGSDRWGEGPAGPLVTCERAWGRVVK